MGAKAFAVIALAVGGVTAWDIMVNPRCRRMLPWSDIIDCAIKPPCTCPTVGTFFDVGRGTRIGESSRQGSGRRNIRGSGSGGTGSGSLGLDGDGGAIPKFGRELTPYTKLKRGPAKSAQQQQNNAAKHSQLQSRFSPQTTYRPIRGMQTQNPPGGVRPQKPCEWWDIICNLSRGRTIFGQQHQAIPGINPLNLPKIQIPTLPRIVLPTI